VGGSIPSVPTRLVKEERPKARRRETRRIVGQQRETKQKRREEIK
jgi:hypothetical protein